MDSFKKLFNLGLGAMVVTKEKAEEVINQMVEEGKIAEGQGKEIIDQLVERGQQQNKNLEEKISKAVEKAITELNLATKEDINNLSKEIDQIKNNQS